MNIASITEFGKNWTQSQKILNSLATPVGHRFCQPARYPKNRELAEKWVEIRDKWVAVLQKIDPEINADCLPYDDGKYRYCSGFYHSFKHGNMHILFYLTLEDAIYARRSSSFKVETMRIVYWNAEHQWFDVV